MILALTPHYASDYSILLALVDLIPVALFLMAGWILLKNTYGRIGRLYYAAISSGTVMVFVAGLLKSIWKLIAASGICDYAPFNLLFLPVSSVGFTLVAIGACGLFRKENKALSVVILPFLAVAGEEPLEMMYSGLPFIIIQTLSCAALMILLFVYALKNKKTLSWFFMIIAFVTMWGMGGLAAMDGKMNVTLWNWLEEIVNTASQGTFLLAVYFLYKKEKV